MIMTKGLRKDEARKKAFRALLSVVIVFLLLFSLFFFAYFMPVKNEHDKIAELPSHDLRLFIEEYAEAQDSGMTRADILTALNNDTFVGSRGYSYFYDDEHSLFMKLGTDTRFWDSSGKATYSIGEYARFRMYYADPGDHFRRALGLGPIYCWVYELSDKKSNIVGTIASERYWFLYQYS
ncbi:MAG: hypothetical protein LBL25_02940, partial [Oscillospiraceae bacterium]|nr:hypothetical protein [Oscillospiraceae bacterium]